MCDWVAAATWWIYFVPNSFVNKGNYFTLSWLNYKSKNSVFPMFPFVIDAIPWNLADIKFFSQTFFPQIKNIESVVVLFNLWYIRYKWDYNWLRVLSIISKPIWTNCLEEGNIVFICYHSHIHWNLIFLRFIASLLWIRVDKR